jgi:CDGSH-type Zn-finger protein
MSGGETEAARITPYRDGPILVRGPFTLTDQDGNEIETHQKTIALCRCGRSARKPFCDGTHKATGWRADSSAQQRPASGRFLRKV